MKDKLQVVLVARFMLLIISCMPGIWVFNRVTQWVEGDC